MSSRICSVRRDVGNDKKCRCPDDIKKQYPGIRVYDLANFRHIEKKVTGWAMTKL